MHRESSPATVAKNNKSERSPPVLSLSLTELLKMMQLEKRTSALEDMSTETSKTEKQRKQRKKIKPEEDIQGLWDSYKMCDTWVMGTPEEERESLGLRCSLHSEGNRS